MINQTSLFLTEARDMLSVSLSLIERANQKKRMANRDKKNSLQMRPSRIKFQDDYKEKKVENISTGYRKNKAQKKK